MTGKSKRELLAALRPSYLRASKAEKGRILDQFVLATRYHRKYAIHLLKHGPPKPACRPRAGNSPYGIMVVQALTHIWEQSGYLCGKRLHAFLPLWIEASERTGNLSLDPKITHISGFTTCHCSSVRSIGSASVLVLRPILHHF